MSDIHTITAEEVKAKLDDGEQLYIIDVRENFEVANGMIPGAVHMPMNSVPEQLDMFDSRIPYIIVCAAGVRSEQVTAYLVANNIEAYSMDGGMYAWTGDVE